MAKSLANSFELILVGERANTQGSKKFQEFIFAENWKAAADFAFEQIKHGAGMIDLCLIHPERDELKDMESFLPFFVPKIQVPILIDSMNAEVVETCLKRIKVPKIVNSVNFSQGQAYVQAVLSLVHKYNAGVVVGCRDEDPNQGMAITRERKMDIATRAYSLLTNTYAIAAENIYWDALLFPCGVGEKKFATSAAETLAALELLKEKFPGTKTILGISNISFGLPLAGRAALDAFFLHHCVDAGLDLAIVNAERLRSFCTLSAEEINICENILWNHGKNAAEEFTDFFINK